MPDSIRVGGHFERSSICSATHWEGDGMTSDAQETTLRARRGFYDRIRAYGMTPLWETLHTLVTPQPTSPVIPHIWRYEKIAPFLLEAGGLITAREAERRVLILQNPGLDHSAITQSLYAGLQLVLPGDVAPAHRHSQTALRFIMEGAGGFTAVDGEKAFMQAGDLVITAAGRWHDHGNDTDRPIVWLDVLDIPLVSFLDAGFAEHANAQAQVIDRPSGDSARRYGYNLAPIDFQPSREHSPLINYPYTRSREVLAAIARTDEPDPCHGHKLRYVNPANGGHVSPTIAAFLQLLPAGFETQCYRSTDASIFCVVEGEGESLIGGVRLGWAPRDVFVVPSWLPVTHISHGEAVLFSASDRAAQERLGLWRELR
jgi:gentisate 1,2-dioxygenase